MGDLDRVVIVGVVHGQQSCIDEVRRVISERRPDVVAIELPPATSDAKPEDLEETKARIELSHGTFFRVLEGIGFSGAADLRPLALGLAMQGFEFLAGIEAAHQVGARIEFIDMARDRLFWDLLKDLPAPGMRMPSFKAIATGIGRFLEEWKQLLDALVQIYAEHDYKALASKIGPLLETLDKNTLFKDVLVDQRNRYMASKIAALIAGTPGTIVVLTGFGHVEGLTRELAAMLATNGGNAR